MEQQTNKTVMDILNDAKKEPETLLWHDMEILVRQSLTLPEMMQFVEAVVFSCFDKESDTYLPQLQTFAMNVCLVQGYTNLELPEELVLQYDLLTNTDLISAIYAKIDKAQYRNIAEAVDKKIAAHLHKQPRKVEQAVIELMDGVKELLATTAESLPKVSQEDVQTVLLALKNGAFDSDKLVESYMKYAKTQEDK